MAASGVVNALVRIRLPDLVRTEYGWLVIGKLVALCLLGVLGWRQRRTGIAALRADPGARAPLIRLALVEAVLFGGDIRYRRRTGPHAATAAARRAELPSRSRSAMTSRDRPLSRGCCSTGVST